MLGEELRRLRERRGLTQLQVAEAAGISRSSLTTIESGGRYPTLRTLEALAGCLQIVVTITPNETIIEAL